MAPAISGETLFCNAQVVISGAANVKVGLRYADLD
jgi:hypothetical protein